MKSLKYMMATGCLLSLGLTSCTDFLDVNVDPDKPNNTTAEVDNRVPWIERMYMYSAGVTNYRTAMIAGALYSTSGSHNMELCQRHHHHNLPDVLCRVCVKP